MYNFRVWSLPPVFYLTLKINIVSPNFWQKIFFSLLISKWLSLNHVLYFSDQPVVPVTDVCGVSGPASIPAVHTWGKRFKSVQFTMAVDASNLKDVFYVFFTIISNVRRGLPLYFSLGDVFVGFCFCFKVWLGATYTIGDKKLLSCKNIPSCNLAVFISCDDINTS